MYDLAGLRDKLAAMAVQVGDTFNVRLGYSPESVKQVERILGKLHTEFKRTRNDDGLNGIALEFAAYIIKVIECNYAPGVWERNHTEFGNDSFPYRWLGREIFPYAWCQKRIFDGKGDNVWSKFKVLVVREAG